MFACLDKPDTDGAVWWYEDRDANTPPDKQVTGYEAWLTGKWDAWGIQKNEHDGQRDWWPECEKPDGVRFTTKIHQRPFERMAAQQSHHTIYSRLQEDHDAWFDEEVPWPQRPGGVGVDRGRWILKARAKNDILLRLKVLGLTPNALRFPFFDHVASQVEREILGCSCRGEAASKAGS